MLDCPDHWWKPFPPTVANPPPWGTPAGTHASRAAVGRAVANGAGPRLHPATGVSPLPGTMAAQRWQECLCGWGWAERLGRADQGAGALWLWAMALAYTGRALDQDRQKNLGRLSQDETREIQLAAVRGTRCAWSAWGGAPLSVGRLSPPLLKVRTGVALLARPPPGACPEAWGRSLVSAAGALAFLLQNRTAGLQAAEWGPIAWLLLDRGVALVLAHAPPERRTGLADLFTVDPGNALGSPKSGHRTSMVAPSALTPMFLACRPPVVPLWATAGVLWGEGLDRVPGALEALRRHDLPRDRAAAALRAWLDSAPSKPVQALAREKALSSRWAEAAARPVKPRL